MHVVTGLDCVVGDDEDAEVAVSQKHRARGQTRYYFADQTALAVVVLAVHGAVLRPADQAAAQVVCHYDLEHGPVAGTVLVGRWGKGFTQLFVGREGEGRAIEDVDVAPLPGWLGSER